MLKSQNENKERKSNNNYNHNGIPPSYEDKSNDCLSSYGQKYLNQPTIDSYNNINHLNNNY